MTSRLAPAAFAAAVMLLALSAPAAALAAARPADADLAALLDGVREIAAPGVPGPLVVFGDRAFPVVTGRAGGATQEAVVAAARLGDGRVVAFGHDGYFDPQTLAVADTGRLMTAAVRWAAGKAGAGGPRVAVRREAGLLKFLADQGLKAEALDGADWPALLKDFRVLCVNPVRLPADADREAVARFVREGGGLIADGLGWGWQQLNPGKDLVTDHPASRLVGPAGIVWADGTLERTAAAGFAAGSPPPPLVHALRAFEAVIAHDAGKAALGPEDLAQASATLARAARSIPGTDTLFVPRLRALRQAHQADAGPTPEKPIRKTDVLARLLVTIELAELRRLSPLEVRPHPAAAAFPGAVPAAAPRVHRTVAVNTAVPDWHSTGLYAPPGEKILVMVPEAAADKGLRVRIGSHADSLWHLDTWRRAPEICRTCPIAAATTRAANPFGGLIYVEVPRGCSLGTVDVKIAGGVEAPYFVRGRTDLAAWRERLRALPAPWAELATDKVILTVPSRAVRTLDDPEDLLAFWDRVMDACAELAARPLARPRPERYVTDIQISAGYMHSGYPIMTLLDMPEVLVNKARLMANDHGGIWGLFHETGHNHQSGDWTFAGTGEVTVNLFTMYVFDHVLGMPPEKAHGAISPQARARNLKAYLAAPDFEKWQRDPFLALLMYMQVREAFGWDAFKKVFAEYRDLPRGQRPRSDAEKRDQWLVRLSRTVGRNLGPFFQAWAVPTSESARASIADLPPWMPEELAGGKP